MYNYFFLPCPAPPSVVAAYKSLRLSSLRVDAACFGSTYTREATFTDDKWRERLDSPFKRTFVASVSSTSSFKMEGKEMFPDGSSWVTVLAPSQYRGAPRAVRLASQLGTISPCRAPGASGTQRQRSCTGVDETWTRVGQSFY